MTDREYQKRLECYWSHCKYFRSHCEVFHGNECNQLHGGRIPRMKTISGMRSPVVPQSPLGIKPCFMASGD